MLKHLLLITSLLVNSIFSSALVTSEFSEYRMPNNIISIRFELDSFDDEINIEGIDGNLIFSFNKYALITNQQIMILGTRVYLDQSLAECDEGDKIIMATIIKDELSSDPKMIITGDLNCFISQIKYESMPQPKILVQIFSKKEENLKDCLYFLNEQFLISVSNHKTGPKPIKGEIAYDSGDKVRFELTPE